MDKILIIEEDVQVRDSVSLSLESVGYQVVEVASCQEGLQHQRQHGVSAIISDAVSLQDEDGELLRQICQEMPHLPLITLLGNSSDSGVFSSITSSSHTAVPHTLRKPFTLDELLETVQTALTS